MKKLCALLFLLFLTACGSMSGESYTRCADVADSLLIDDIGETVITVQGYDDEILLWTVSTTVTREEFREAYSHDTYLSDDEIHELFEYYTESEVEGITFHIDEITSEHIVIVQVYDYSVIDINYLNRIWDVNNFETAVTLSSSIAELEDRGAVCAIVEIEDDEDEEEVESEGEELD